MTITAEQVRTCTCTPAWPELVATINGEDRPAHPVEDHSAAESVGEAFCTGCGIAYPDHWTLDKTAFTPVPTEGAKATKPTPVKDASELLARIVAQRPNGEVRPQQERMVSLVEEAIKTNTHLLVQAGTGTGKSLGYLIPAVNSGKRVIISTATKQLGEQIIEEDMPTLANIIPKVGGRNFSYALIKGRQNYICLREVDSLVRMDEQGAENADATQTALFDDPTPRENSRRPSADDLKKLNSLLQWADTTPTGDRTDAPAVPDKVWDQVSTDAAGCTGKACPFVEDCFSEAARAEARVADVVVTNHAQVAQDLRSEFPLLGEWDVLVTDEVHELESYLSSAWGLEVAASSMKHQIAVAARKLPRGDRTDYAQARDQAVQVIDDLDALNDVLAKTKEGLLPDMPSEVGALLVSVAHKLRTLMSAFELSAGESGASASVAADRKGAGQKIAHLCEAVVAMCADMSDGKNVRWLEAGFGTRGPVLKVAPLWIGPTLMRLLEDRTLIATSATITVGGRFDAFVRTLALNEPRSDDDGAALPPRKYHTEDVGTPFDYSTQAMLYIPAAPFPVPVGTDRFAHTEAVLDEAVALVKAAGGRTLALFTTRRAAEQAAAHLRSNVNTPILCQGEAPPSQLIAEFKADEHTTLCATMGFWHGVNAPGATLSLVITDKIPFAPMFDPLMSARRTAVDNERRGQGFDEVFVAGAAVMLAQGVGRLIRTATDKGVVAVLDPRILTKGYGPTMINSMPPMRIFRDRTVVEGALARLAQVADTEAGLVTPTGTATKGAVAKKATVSAPPRKAAPRKSNTKALARSTKKDS